MFQLSLIDDGHGFEAAMWVLANTALFLGGIEVMRSSVVQQQERIELVSIAVGQ